MALPPGLRVAMEWLAGTWPAWLEGKSRDGARILREYQVALGEVREALVDLERLVGSRMAGASADAYRGSLKAFTGPGGYLHQGQEFAASGGRYADAVSLQVFDLKATDIGYLVL